VKIDDDNEAKEYGLENLPVLIYFENKVSIGHKYFMVVFRFLFIRITLDTV